MGLKLPDSWQTVVGNELEKPYFKTLEAFVDSERQNYTVYPKESEGILFAGIYTLCSCASRNPWSGSLSRAAPGSWVQLLGKTPCVSAAVFTQYLQRTAGRCWCYTPRSWLPGPMGQAGCLAAQHRIDGARRSGELPSRERLGGIHGCRYSWL